MSGVLGIPGRSPRNVQVKISALQAIPNNATTAVAWASVNYDTSSFWDSAAPTRLTIPAGWGPTKVSLVGSLDFETNATGLRSITIQKNGTTRLVEAVLAASSAHFGMNASVHHLATGGDYFELMAYHNKGSAMNLQVSVFVPTFSLSVIG